MLSFKYNNNIEAPTIIENFKTVSNIPITLSSKEISKIKRNIIKPLNTLNLEELYKSIKSNSFEIIVKSTDTKYEYINNKDPHNNKEQREEKIIVFGTKESLKLLNDKDVNEYFIDITFKSIPKKFRPYKLLTISCFNKKYKCTNICCFTCIKYLDVKSYLKAFQFINELFQFNPHIVDTDYEHSLKIALKEKNLFKNPILHTSCYFHFSKAIKEEMKKLSLYKKN